MSLELVAKQVKEAIKSLPLLVKVQESLDEVLIATSAAAAAEKRLAVALAAITVAQEDQRAILAGSNRIKDEADKLLSDAKADAAKIRAEAKSKGEIALSKAMDKAAIVTKEADVAQEKFIAQKSTNDEILGMLQAQIAHGEARLSEIRAAIAKITGA